MNEPNNGHDLTSTEELVAYLDGELDAEAERCLDARLAEDAALRQKLEQHRRAWDLLDELPGTGVGEDFTRTTVEMVAVSVAGDVDDASRRDSRGKMLGWLMGGAVTVAASLAGYALIASIAAAPDRQLVEDIRVIENLDEYRAVEDIEFLLALEREGLFATEATDGP